ncbi:glycosyltransferase family 4 protein [Pyrobaculum arsenaticum]|uniref:Glycosyltransferase family 4 protein n=1 Tax=Pyrobaculum arsenaticum TaxID=121277 RepID=A0A7L4PCN4_9CREN|nr:glycosyltransferase family 4 protein [Pyrobaculum arsenaticum]
MMVGADVGWVEAKARRLSLKSVVFLNKMPAQQYYDTMYRARVVVMSSIWLEPFGRIPLEANRLGVPAVVKWSIVKRLLLISGIQSCLRLP